MITVRPNQNLLSALNSEDYSLDRIRLLLERHPIEEKHERVVHGESPLVVAILRNLGTDCMKLLINHGVNIDQLSLCNNNPLRSSLRIAIEEQNNIDNRMSVVKFLLDNGANVNNAHYFINSQGYAVSCFLRNSANWSHKLFLPILKLILTRTNTNTKTNHLKILFRETLECIVRLNEFSEGRKFCIKNAIQAVKLLIHSGAHPKVDMFKHVFDHLSKFPTIHLKPRSRLGSLFIKQLCELPIECIILRNFKRGDFMKRYLQTMDFKATCIKLTSGTQDFESSTKVYRLKSLFNYVKRMWKSRFEKSAEMKVNFLKNDLSLWAAIEHMCGINSGINDDIVFELLHQLSRDKSSLFRCVVCHTAKNVDWVNFYLYVRSLKKRSGDVHFVNRECFLQISRELSKEDVFNFLLAICFNRN